VLLTGRELAEEGYIDRFLTNTMYSINSGSASAVKEPGHFEVKKSSSQVTRMHFFPSKKLVVALKTQAANAVSPSK